MLPFPDGQPQAQDDELPEVADETGYEGDQGEDPDGDVHRLLGTYFICQVPGQELGQGVPEKEYGTQPSI